MWTKLVGLVHSGTRSEKSGNLRSTFMFLFWEGGKYHKMFFFSLLLQSWNVYNDVTNFKLIQYKSFRIYIEVIERKKYRIRTAWWLESPESRKAKPKTMNGARVNSDLNVWIHGEKCKCIFLSDGIQYCFILGVCYLMSEVLASRIISYLNGVNALYYYTA